MIDENSRFRRRLLEFLCGNMGAILLLIVLCIILLLLSLFALLFVQPGTSSFVVLIVDIALLVPFLVVLGFAYRSCRRWEG